VRNVEEGNSSLYATLCHKSQYCLCLCGYKILIDESFCPHGFYRLRYPATLEPNGASAPFENPYRTSLHVQDNSREPCFNSSAIDPPLAISDLTEGESGRGQIRSKE
jgi:hypothetical protein